MHSLANAGSSLRAAFYQARDALASIIFPAPCRLCEGLLDTASRIPICTPCLESLTPWKGPRCCGCGGPIVSKQFGIAQEGITGGEATPAAPVVGVQLKCRLCRIGAYGFDCARCYGLYHGAMMRAIVLLKYERLPPLGNWFAARLAEVAAPESEALAADVVVPVPLHPTRLRERGYNQAELIARPLARRLGLPMRMSLLVRTKPRPEKHKLSVHERWDSVRGAFATRSGSPVDNLSVLLVDNVMTTGATLDACARVLKSAGARRVIALAVSRAARNIHVMPQDATERAKGTR